MAGDFLRALSGQTPSQVNMGGPVGWGLRGMSMVPGPVGWLGTLGSMGVRGNNMGFTNRARASWGQDGLDFGQTIGGLLGMNSYGGGGERDKLGDFRGVDVTPSGMSSRGGFLGIGAEPTGAYTPGEAQKRAAAARYGSPFGTPVRGPVTPTPVQPAPSVPSPVRAISARDAFDMSRFNDDPDPIGAAIRSMGGPSGNGGGRSSGGGGGRSSGGGRSDRSSMSSGRG